MIKKYEYKCVSILKFEKKIQKILNEYGDEGWELICVWGTFHYFKREKKKRI